MHIDPIPAATHGPKRHIICKEFGHSSRNKPIETDYGLASKNRFYDQRGE
jgi:hypothetical protein